MIGDLLAGHEGYGAIRQLPGIGPVLAAVIVAEIGDIRRFPGPGQLGCWAGLTPRHYESDLKVIRGHVTKQGSRMLRFRPHSPCPVVPVSQLACLAEAARLTWFRDKRQRGRSSRTARAAGPLARRWRLSLHGDKAESALGGGRGDPAEPAGSRPREVKDAIIARRGTQARNIAKVAAARELLTLVFYAMRDGRIRRATPPGQAA